jgi:hypothetical protein
MASLSRFGNMRNPMEVLPVDTEEEADEETDDGPFERLLQLEIRQQVEAAWQLQQKLPVWRGRNP